ncbi:uncharacterized protein N7483_007604 [Penicillium malachiteum]|uniref:uncharacterized protein n=1 Tax=Penicillium malachiteum TaxID=1324776 RepID=UPI0025476BA0|nr:uncharacterized protein N7483_007604 [Penicillium malachiteum]KAJ5726247.1 hypothetical protein N7483_007604 [Penicillium malachiteum]
MPTPLSQATHHARLPCSRTCDRKKCENCEISFEKQKPIRLKETALVQLDVTKINNRADTEYVALVVPDSSKDPANSISRRRNEVGVSLHKIQTQFNTRRVDTFSSKVNLKQKQNKRSQFGKTHDEASEIITPTASSPMDISLLSVFFRSSQIKRTRKTAYTLWKLPTSNDVNTDFSDPERIYLGLEAKRLSSSKQDLGSEQASRLRETVAIHKEQLQAVASITSGKLDRGHETNSPPPKEMKRESNQDAFPMAVLEPHLSRQGLKEVETVPKSLLKIVPLELIQHLREDSRRCPAWTIQGKRCKLHRPNRSFSAELQSVATSKPKEFLLAIQDLLEVAFCATHRKVASKEFQTWKEEFQELSKIHEYESICTMKNERLRDLVRWIRLLGRTTLSQPSLPSCLQPTANNTAQEEPLMVNPIQKFDPYISKTFSGTISQELARLIAKPLGPCDLKYQGSMYVFWQRGNFGHLKIGRSENVSRRLKEWNKQCKKTMELHFPEPAKKSDEQISDLQQVPHISRVEALVHLELNYFRRIEKKCPGCSKSHMEWFEVSKDIAIRVIRKWTAWISTLPYEQQIKDCKEQWILKREELKNLDKLCSIGMNCSIPSLPTVKGEKRSRSRPRLRQSLSR